MMTGKESKRAKSLEGVIDCRPRCLGRQPFAPVLPAQLKPELVQPARQIIRPQSTASDVLFALFEENGPVLNTVQPLLRKLNLEPLVHFGFAERSADQRAHARVSPQCEGQRPVLGAPEAEHQPGGRSRYQRCGARAQLKLFTLGQISVSGRLMPRQIMIRRLSSYGITYGWVKFAPSAAER